MSQNLLHFCIYFSTGQFAQRLLADSDVPIVDLVSYRYPVVEQTRSETEQTLFTSQTGYRYPLPWPSLQPPWLAPRVILAQYDGRTAKSWPSPNGNIHSHTYLCLPILYLNVSTYTTTHIITLNIKILTVNS